VKLTPLETFACWFSLAILALAAIGPLIAPYPTQTASPPTRLHPPSGVHWLGTDENGMDIFSRILAAPRIDVVVALLATAISVGVGAPLGVIAGYFERNRRLVASIVGEAILRLLDVIQAFPVFILAMVLVAIRGASTMNIVAAVAFVNMPVFLRLVRSEVLGLKERTYAEAARAVGNSDLQVGFKHVLPNAWPPIVVQVSVTVGFAILLTAGLSFVGAGISPPAPELGAMISSGAKFMITGQWWISLFPGIALGLIVFAFGVVGETLGRLLQPAGLASEEAPGPVAAVSSPGLNQATADVAKMAENVLEVAGLTVEFTTPRQPLRVLTDVSFSLGPGVVLGVVGEAGAGKSVLVRSLLQLLPENGRIITGSVRFKDVDLTRLDRAKLKRLRATGIAHILPDAKSQLNPLVRVGEMMVTVMRAHSQITRAEACERAASLLARVGVADPRRRLEAYPHELSGGMAQRVCIALALMHNPSLIIADEPTAGLDVTVQRQVLDLMAGLVREREAAQLIVTRDLGIVAHYCQWAGVMRGGRIVELATTQELFDAPQHPYTRAILGAVASRRRAPAYHRTVSR
jgi:peptide/nickel transport system permease protein